MSVSAAYAALYAAQLNQFSMFPHFLPIDVLYSSKDEGCVHIVMWLEWNIDARDRWEGDAACEEEWTESAVCRSPSVSEELRYQAGINGGGFPSTRSVEPVSNVTQAAQLDGYEVQLRQWVAAMMCRITLSVLDQSYADMEWPTAQPAALW